MITNEINEIMNSVGTIRMRRRKMNEDMDKGEE